MTVPDPVETAWRIHDALCDWTGKVDNKAAFALTIESATLAVIVGLSGTDRSFGRVQGLWSFLFWLGISLLALAAVAAVSVVAPRTRARHLAKEWKTNFIYFGHLKSWSADELSSKLRQTDPLPVLSHQLVEMSKIAWQKHRRVKQSLTLAVIGTALVAIAGVLT